jgi:hypothetical protein
LQAPFLPSFVNFVTLGPDRKEQKEDWIRQLASCLSLCLLVLLACWLFFMLVACFANLIVRARCPAGGWVGCGGYDLPAKKKSVGQSYRGLISLRIPMVTARKDATLGALLLDTLFTHNVPLTRANWYCHHSLAPSFPFCVHLFRARPSVRAGSFE